MRRVFYRVASLLGDLRAIQRGPAAVGRRVACCLIYGRALRDGDVGVAVAEGWKVRAI